MIARGKLTQDAFSKPEQQTDRISQLFDFCGELVNFCGELVNFCGELVNFCGELVNFCGELSYIFSRWGHGLVALEISRNRRRHHHLVDILGLPYPGSV